MNNKETNIDDEKWLPVVGFEDWYVVSNYGQVKRIAYGRYKTPRNEFTKTWISKHGYICFSQNSVHKAVAMAFLSDTYQVGLEVNHIDGNKQNNHVNNLEWITPKQNCKHAWEIGLKENTRRHSLQSKTQEQKMKISKSLKGTIQTKEAVKNRMNSISKNLNDGRKVGNAEIYEVYSLEKKLLSNYYSQSDLIKFLKNKGIKNARVKILENKIKEYIVRRVK